VYVCVCVYIHAYIHYMQTLYTYAYYLYIYIIHVYTLYIYKYTHTCMPTHTHTHTHTQTHLLGHVLSEAFDHRFLAGKQPHHLIHLPGTPAQPVVGLLQERVGTRLVAREVSGYPQVTNVDYLISAQTRQLPCSAQTQRLLLPAATRLPAGRRGRQRVRRPCPDTNSRKSAP
jgi:hypothetical protein